MQLRYCSFLLFLFTFLSAGSASAQLVADPDPLDYGNVLLTEFKDGQVTLRNPTGSEIAVTNFYLFGGNARDNEFSILSPANRFFPVAAGGSRNIQIRFAPDFEGGRSKFLIVETNTDTLRIVLEGTGLLTNPILTLSITDISFGKVSVTGQKQAIVDITNVGEDDAKVSDVNVANFSGIEHFRALPDDPSKPFPVILKQGESMKLRVLFVGAEPTGFKAGVLNLVGSVGGQTVINVNGEVVEADIVVTPDPVDFGDVPIGVAEVQTVSIGVLGEEPVKIEFLEVYPPFSFVDPPDLPITIIAGEPYTIQVQVIPEILGEASSQLQIISPDLAGSNFRGIDMIVRGTGALAIQRSDDFTYLCASKKLQRRSTTLLNRSMDELNLQSATAPAGIQLLTDLPLSIQGHGTREVEYTFDPTTASGPQRLYFEYLDETGSVIYDTVLATPLPTTIRYSQTANGAANTIQVAPSLDFTDLESSRISIDIQVHTPDVLAIIRDSITLDSKLLPNATFDLLDNGAGSYTLEITSLQPIEFDPAIPISEQQLFTYRPKLYLASESSTFVTIGGTPDETCVTYPADSTLISREDFCGDDLVERSLRGQSITSMRLYPNPVISEQLQLTFEALRSDRGAIDVIDLLGSALVELPLTMAEGTNHLKLNVGSLPEGTYLIRLRTADQVEVRKFTIER